MAYFVDIVSPETWKAFRESGATVSRFRLGQRPNAVLRLAEQVRPGNLFLCYMRGLSRWCGVLEVESSAHFDENPRLGNSEAFPIWFKIKPVVLLEPESAVPIKDSDVWDNLTFTKQSTPGDTDWTWAVRRPLRRIEDGDGELLVKLLKQQEENPRKYPLTNKDRRHLSVGKVQTLDREVEVEVPYREDEEPSSESEGVEPDPVLAGRESIRYQAKIAQIGAEMGFRIWVPRNDKARVLEHVPAAMHKQFLDSLPLNYDEQTLKTVEQIDVLWLNGRSMARAFEIEHTTAVYSGLLRMADLLALQPNMDIRLHIVAPRDRRERVLREINRPVFGRLERGPLYEQCSFLPYDSIDSLAQNQHLAYPNHTIIDEYAEAAEV